MMRHTRLTGTLAPLATIALVLLSGTTGTTMVRASAPALAARSTAPAAHPFIKAKHLDNTTNSFGGLTPQQLITAYKLPGHADASTIGISIAYHSPTLLEDVNTRLRGAGLRPIVLCRTAAQRACLDLRDAVGGTSYPTSDFEWGFEETLDVFVAASLSPRSRIVVAEADAAEYFGDRNLGETLNTLVGLGARIVNMSYGSIEFPAEVDFATQYLSTPGIRYVAASGDSGTGATFPGTAPHVVSVGGTSLTLRRNSHRLSETVWSGTGGGCSLFIPKPADQHGHLCGNQKYQNDVAAVADPNTGIALSYESDTYLVGGTSLSAPIISAAYALTGPHNIRPNRSKKLFDITIGSNGTCTVPIICNASHGLDGVTGWGTLKGTQALTDRD